MTMPRFTVAQHAVAVASVLAISLLLHGAFGLTGVAPVGPASASVTVGDQAAIILPPTLR